MKAWTACVSALTFALAAGAEEAKPLPRVLIIGDSISIGYMEPLVEMLKGKAEVVHNEANAEHTRNGVAKLDAWLGTGKWDVIHFNFGLHDLKYVDDKGANVATAEAGHLQIPVEEYRKNLTTIAKRLKETGAKVIFATTTPFPDTVRGPLRKPSDLAVYNQAALEVMKAEGIEVNDLHVVAEAHLKEWQRPDNVHFLDPGHKGLAEAVATAILGALEKKAAA